MEQIIEVCNKAYKQHTCRSGKTIPHNGSHLDLDTLLQ